MKRFTILMLVMLSLSVLAAGCKDNDMATGQESILLSDVPTDYETETYVDHRLDLYDQQPRRYEADGYGTR